MSQAHMEESVTNNDALAPVLDPALLARIHQLNLDYLELLVSERDTAPGVSQLQYLPPRQRAAMALLSPEALRSVAAMPYTLYSLGFEDEKFWSAVSVNATAVRPDVLTHRYARMGDESAHYVFCELALFHAWHVAATNIMAARVVYAMPYATAQRLARTPLWQIRCIAASYGMLMMPRWPTNTAFWPDLIRFAGMNDTRRLQITRLQGLQLIAQELEVACELSRPRTPIVASPRLRARKLQMAPRVTSNPTSFHVEDPKPK
ncbi:hypothetical protein JM946_04155 [Steroidobacter sp. S1-65]|uniref:Uncharacterized protein n=1 Tax=Steroidobacter gossypii TaxID=2805490 RepID=A0ABS1WSI0_9GAMM|nr:hypothetical protein [Steroidobacter gossypii]MBM0103919.1 hypothetical protein [Steroidobacter gossypii]